MKKKVVWLPYDFDTAIGINNEGSLVFGYELEDVDHTESGADIYNGQNSVMWTNLRDAFGPELASMYRLLRSEGKISYDVIEKAFEDHQDKWPEAIFNEDSWFKYIQPLTDEGTGAYLDMLQGSKSEQRKWWLYNRFRYIDSKYNAGDALSDVIQLRGYAKADITVRPYADIYPSIKYGSYLVQARGHRGQNTLLACPLDALNDTEIYIYSASQLASVGDLSGLLVGFADFSMATKLQSLKIGDSGIGYSNGNLTSLTLGNNVLLQSLDVRNCSNLASAVDLTGCTNLEEIYFDGTAITGVTLPNGGKIRVLHLPSTITNLTIQNQTDITDLVAPVSNLSTLRIENCPTVDTEALIRAIPANTRVRLIGFRWEATNAAEITGLFNILDTMRGLDESGNNVDTAQVSGIIHTSSLTGDEIEDFNSRYPYVTVQADHVSTTLNYYNYDGSTLLYSETILDGGDGTYTGTPERADTAQYSYSFVGWNYVADQTTAQANATKVVTTNRDIYAAYSRTTRTYTATFVRASEDGGGTLYTQTNIPYGTTPTYGGTTPTTTRGDTTQFQFNGWSPALSGITGNTTYTAVFKDLTSITRGLIRKTILTASHSTVSVIRDYAFYSCYALTSANFPAVTSIGSYAFRNCSAMTSANFPAATSIGTNAFQYCSSLTSANFPAVTSIGSSTFQNCFALTSANFPAVTSIGANAFNGCRSLTSANFPAVTSIGIYAFSGCRSLTSANFPAVTSIGANAFYSCRSLTSAYFLNSSIATLVAFNAFSNTPMSNSTYTGSFGSIYVPASLVSAYKTATNWSVYSNRITSYIEE